MECRRLLVRCHGEALRVFDLTFEAEVRHPDFKCIFDRPMKEEVVRLKVSMDNALAVFLQVVYRQQNLSHHDLAFSLSSKAEI